MIAFDPVRIFARSPIFFVYLETPEERGACSIPNFFFQERGAGWIILQKIFDECDLQLLECRADPLALVGMPFERALFG